ncbi:hypothetical protein TNCV_3230061 [Trichonephila clavipes]|nr:hypothetical protein TNCV_3230061 [Trichonephila clavipes]
MAIGDRSRSFETQSSDEDDIGARTPLSQFPRQRRQILCASVPLYDESSVASRLKLLTRKAAHEYVTMTTWLPRLLLQDREART